MGLTPIGPRSGGRTILLVCPTMWDESEIPRAVSRTGLQVLSFGADVSEHPEDFDALDFVEEALTAMDGLPIDGIIASDDYPGSILAAVLARRLGLPGPDPKVILLCQHKYYSRLAQREVVPDAVPDFQLLDVDGRGEHGFELPFPFFVKPVKSFFSLFAQEVADAAELHCLSRRARWHLREFVKPFDQLLRAYSDLRLGGGHLLAETAMRGSQVTLEGCISQGVGQLIGVTDSVMYPGSICFQRFEYPSALAPPVQARMAHIAFRLMRSIGFDEGLFNIEMFHDAFSDTIRIIEVNPRMCPQFADLMEKVNGVNTYEIALDIAAGRRPVVRRPDGRHRAAASFALRVFDDRMVSRIPTADEVGAFEASFPDARLKVLCRPGHRLSEELQDGKSFRYAVLNLGGDSRVDVLARLRHALECLPFGLEAIATV